MIKFEIVFEEQSVSAFRDNLGWLVLISAEDGENVSIEMDDKEFAMLMAVMAADDALDGSAEWHSYLMEKFFKDLDVKFRLIP